MKEVFTLKRAYLRNGLLGLVFFASMLVFGAVFPFTDEAATQSPEQPRMLILTYILICYFLAGVSLWIVAAYFREEVILDEDEVTVVGVLRRRHFQASEVIKARWRLHPYSLKLFCQNGTVVLWLENFIPSAQARLMTYFRERLPRSAQQGWCDKLEQYAAGREAKQSSAEFERVFGGLLRMVWRSAIIAPIGGAIFGLVVCLLVAVTDMPTWTGSLFLDGFLVGTGATLVAIGVMYVMLRVMKWMDQPEW